MRRRRREDGNAKPKSSAATAGPAAHAQRTRPAQPAGADIRTFFASTRVVAAPPAPAQPTPKPAHVHAPELEAKRAPAPAPATSNASTTDGAEAETTMCDLHAHLRLVRSQDTLAPALVCLSKRVVLIGRLSSCDVQLIHREVLLISRVHALLECVPSPLAWQWSVHDRASMNGLTVNGAKRLTACLRTGDRIGFGKFLDLPADARVEAHAHVLVEYSFEGARAGTEHELCDGLHAPQAWAALEAEPAASWVPAEPEPEPELFSASAAAAAAAAAARVADSADRLATMGAAATVGQATTPHARLAAGRLAASFALGSPLDLSPMIGRRRSHAEDGVGRAAERAPEAAAPEAAVLASETPPTMLTSPHQPHEIRRTDTVVLPPSEGTPVAAIEQPGAPPLASDQQQRRRRRDADPYAKVLAFLGGLAPAPYGDS